MVGVVGVEGVVWCAGQCQLVMLSWVGMQGCVGSGGDAELVVVLELGVWLELDGVRWGCRVECGAG